MYFFLVFCKLVLFKKDYSLLFVYGYEVYELFFMDVIVYIEIVFIV